MSENQYPETISSEELMRVVHQGYKIPLLCQFAGCSINQNRIAVQGRGGASAPYDVPRETVQTWLNEGKIRMSLDTTPHDIASGLRDDPVAFLGKYKLTDPRQSLIDKRRDIDPDPIRALFDLPKDKE